MYAHAAPFDVDPEAAESPMAIDLHQTRMATAAEPPFHAEVEQVWRRPWGAHDEVGRLRVGSCAPGPEC
jgi:hypothetical protein